MASSFLVGAFITLAALDSGATVETSLAWEGTVSTEALTELTVTARSDSDTALTITTESNSPRISATVTLDSAREIQAWVPALPDSGGLVLSTKPGTTRTIDAQPGAAPIVLLGDYAVDRFADWAHVMPLAPSDLPRLASAYKHIRAIVFAGDKLAQLDEAQIRALAEHVGDCGRVLLVDVSAEVADLLMQRAGCGGRAFATAKSADDVTLQLRALLEKTPRPMPGQKALQRLLDRQQTDVTLMAAFLFGFLVVFVLLAIVPGTRTAALGFCIIATGFIGLLWSGGHRDTFVAWAEVEDGYRVARYSGLEALASGGRGEQSIRAQSLGRSPHWISGADLTLIWSAQPAARQLHWLPHLLQEIQIVTNGSFPVEPILRAGLTDGLPTVCNLGAATTPAAYLRWRDTTYAVPALAPEQRWSPDDDHAVRQRSAPLRLMAARAQGNTVTLLQPLRLQNESRGNQHAWLMRRELDDSEDSPCRG